MTIRDNAIHCEVRKIAYRQSKDGVVISFVIHPNEVPEQLATANLGTRYMLALVEIDDDETPKVHGGEAPQPSTCAAQHCGSASKDESPIPRGEPPPRKPVAPEKRLAQQAGICCADPVFRKFLEETVAGLQAPVDEFSAAAYVRIHCGVETRSQIRPGTIFGQKWETLHAKFLGWRDHDMPAKATA